EVTSPVVDQRRQPLGTGPTLPDQLLRASPGVRRERGVGGGEDAGQHDEGTGDDQAGRTTGRVAHRALTEPFTSARARPRGAGPGGRTSPGVPPAPRGR